MKKTTFAQLINPKNEKHTNETIGLVFFVFVIMVLGKVVSASTAIYLGQSIQDSFDLPNIGATSFSEIGVLLVVEITILLLAIFFFKYKKSFFAACILFTFSVFAFYKISDAYFLSQFADVNYRKLFSSVLYLSAGILGVLATYRLKKLTT